MGHRNPTAIATMMILMAEKFVDFLRLDQSRKTIIIVAILSITYQSPNVKWEMSNKFISYLLFDRPCDGLKNISMNAKHF